MKLTIDCNYEEILQKNQLDYAVNHWIRTAKLNYPDVKFSFEIMDNLVFTIECEFERYDNRHAFSLISMFTRDIETDYITVSDFLYGFHFVIEE